MWAFTEVPSMTAAAGIERWYMCSFHHRPTSYVGLRRTAMARSIVVGASVVHWIETEPRGPAESHHSLVFSQGGALHRTVVVTTLLDVAAQRRGVWPEPAASRGLLAEESIRRTALCRHRNRKAHTPAMPSTG